MFSLVQNCIIIFASPPLYSLNSLRSLIYEQLLFLIKSLLFRRNVLALFIRENFLEEKLVQVLFKYIQLIYTHTYIYI